MTNVQSKQATNLYKEVFLITGVSEATVACVIAEFNKARKFLLGRDKTEVEIGINNESKDEDVDLYSGDKNLNKEE
ncbi:15587_t:CDS:2 [Cetraspora pellucida]|uniref:15587_t:CDS:1 n=1 Tax=Cetraspora pellucida TaxID=1433469 RepID=A0ACA9M978_9GLOM|nr:15587_t:CDS:2 [Cetraspora pellucida]